MAKTKIAFVCTDCGAEHSRWQGKCTACNEWNTLVEFKPTNTKHSKLPSNNKSYAIEDAGLEKLSQVSDQKLARFKTGSNELDRVLGDGIVLGSVVLIAGAPGAGKSTLLIDVLSKLSQLGLITKNKEDEPKKKYKILYCVIDNNGDTFPVIV